MSNNDVLLNKMLPSSLDKNKTIRIINEILQPYITENFESLIPRLFLYGNIDRLPEKLLNHLAYQLHVDFWDNNLPLDKKRILIKNSIKYHKYKGTPYAVEQFLSDIFDDVWIEEWFDYGGEPYHLKIYLKVGDGTPKINLDDEFLRALFTVKNTRSRLEDINIVIDDVIVLKDKTDTYKTKYWMVNEIPSGRAPREAYRGKKFSDVVKVPNKSSVRNNRRVRVNEVKSGGVVNK